jgi:hypothetical protein
MPGRFTWPETQKRRVPPDFPIPSAAKAAPPLATIQGRLAIVSTLLMMVGFP